MENLLLAAAASKLQAASTIDAVKGVRLLLLNQPVLQIAHCDRLRCREALLAAELCGGDRRRTLARGLFNQFRRLREVLGSAWKPELRWLKKKCTPHKRHPPHVIRAPLGCALPHQHGMNGRCQ